MGTIKIRCSMWDFETGALLRHIPLRDLPTVQISKALFLSDMFVVLGLHSAEVFFKGETRCGKLGAILFKFAFTTEKCVG